MTIPDLKAWLAKPTNIMAIGGLIGTIAGTAAHIVTKDLSLTVGVGAIVGSIVALALPDNTGAPSSVEKLVTDAATAVVQKHLAASLPMLLADTMAVVQSFQPPAGVAVPTAAAPIPVAAPVA